MASSGYTAITFVANEQPTTAKWNLIGSNDASFNNGNGLEDNAIIKRHIAAGAIDKTKLDWDSITGGVWWQELGRTTLASASDLISVNSFPAKRWLRVYCVTVGSGIISQAITVNGDTSNNYARRASTNGGGDAIVGSTNNITITNGDSNNTSFIVFDVLNKPGLEKFIMGSVDLSAVGASTVPPRVEFVAKWANTGAQITTITVTNTNTGDFAVGSEMIILGHD